MARNTRVPLSLIGWVLGGNVLWFLWLAGGLLYQYFSELNFLGTTGEFLLRSNRPQDPSIQEAGVVPAGSCPGDEGSLEHQVGASGTAPPPRSHGELAQLARTPAPGVLLTNWRRRFLRKLRSILPAGSGLRASALSAGLAGGQPCSPGRSSQQARLPLAPL